MNIIHLPFLLQLVVFSKVLLMGAREPSGTAWNASRRFPGRRVCGEMTLNSRYLNTKFQCCEVNVAFVFCDCIEVNLKSLLQVNKRLQRFLPGCQATKFAGN